jgi:hypothetical protein
MLVLGFQIVHRLDRGDQVENEFAGVGGNSGHRLILSHFTPRPAVSGTTM